MNNPQFLTQQKSDRPILIVDKRGLIGKRIAEIISENLIVVLVSADNDSTKKNIIRVPFNRKIPKIPDNYYSHIFLIDDGESLNRNIQSFVKKARGDSSKAILIEGIRSKNSKNIDEVSSYQNGTVVYYGDLFSKDFILSPVGKIISDAKIYKRIKIEGDGLESLYPISLEDFVDFLIVKFFVEIDKSKALNIFPTDATTYLGVSRIIQGLDPLVRTDFIKKRSKLSDPEINKSYPPLKNYNVKRQIREVWENQLPDGPPRIEQLKKPKKENTILKRGIIFSLILLIFLAILPLFATLAYGALGLYEIDRTLDALEKGNFSKALSRAKNSKTFFTFSQKTLIPLKSETRIIGLESEALAIEERINTGKSMSNASVDLLEAIEMIEKITKGNSKNPKNDFDNALSLINNSIFEFRVIQAKKDRIPEIERKIDDLAPVIDLISNSLSVSPKALGFDGEMKYLILFQNNMELRPGGGFIGSFGILDIKNAIVSDFQIYDVYSADGQLKGHIEPPYPIRKHLPQPNFFLRDSNFDPDFTRNASRAANFLALETGIKADGVIAADVDFISGLLKALGDVEVIDYKVRVNSENAFEIINEKSQKNFFPGSTQKKDFLESLYSSIQQKISSGENIAYLTLIKEMTRLLSEKHIMLASSDSGIQDAFSVNSWSSQLIDSRTREEGVFNDYLGVVEANLGIDKVNYEVSRSISKAQIIDLDGKLSSTVTVTYKNSSKSENYKNYLRFILPEEARVSQISFDNIAQRIVPAVTDPVVYESPTFRKPDGLEVEEVFDFDKKIVGFLVEIPKNKSMSISITYDLFQSLSFEPKINYSLKLFKQPGTSHIPFDFSLFYPASYKILQKEPSSEEVGGNRINFGTNLKSDSEFNFSFSKK